MNSILEIGAKYLIILLFAVFTLVSFLVQIGRSSQPKRIRQTFQSVLVIFIHALAFFCFYLKISDGTIKSYTLRQAVILYVCQLLYLIFMMAVLPVIVTLNRALHNVMCMFITVSFIILTRLSYKLSVRQGIFLLIATGIFLIFQFVYKIIKGLYKLTWIYCILSIAAILAVYAFAGLDNGAKIAIDLGFVTLQPFEFVKILFVLFVAAAFNRSNSIMTIIVTAAAAIVHVLLLVACRELGTALILCVVYVLMLYVATKKVSLLAASGILFIAACVAAYLMFSHVRVRVNVWLNPWADIDNTGYQITQSLFAIGSGGWLGQGLYNGYPLYVPEVNNDFIFSAVTEELGAIFSVFLIMLALCFALMIFRIAIRISLPFNKLLAFGIGAVYAFQAFLTIGGAIKLIPSTGINLPFISSGGSSLIASMLMIGIIQGLYCISERDIELERMLVRDRIITADEMEDIDPELILEESEYASSEDERMEKLAKRDAKVKQVYPPLDNTKKQEENALKDTTIVIRKTNKNRVENVNPEDF